MFETLKRVAFPGFRREQKRIARMNRQYRKGAAAFDYGGVPGLGSENTTSEAEITFGPALLQINHPNPLIGSAAVDAGNTNNTTSLRTGLVMAQKDADGKWYEYDPTQTDGRQVARGILRRPCLMLGPTGAVVDKYNSPILWLGYVHANQCIGLDGTARRQLAGKIFFDDDLEGPILLGRLPLAKTVAKTGNYTIVAADNGTCFTNAGAAGAVTFTLPAIAKGYVFDFLGLVNQNIIIASAAGDDIVGFNDVDLDSVALQTSGQIIGGHLRLYTNSVGDKWHVANFTPGAPTITAVD